MLFVSISRVRRQLHLPDTDPADSDCFQNDPASFPIQIYPHTTSCVTLSNYYTVGLTAVVVHPIVIWFVVKLQTGAMSQFYEWRLRKAFYPQPARATKVQVGNSERTYMKEFMSRAAWSFGTFSQTCGVGTC